MIMHSRIAAELLYESEATLRMVDTALDELRIADEDRRSPSPRLQALASHKDEAEEFEVPPEFCVRAFWQVQEVAECVRDGRELLQGIRPQPETAQAGGDQDARFTRVLSLVDRLDSLEASRIGSELIAQLRQEILETLKPSTPEGGIDLQIATAISLLGEAEGRLTRLGHVFDSGA